MTAKRALLPIFALLLGLPACKADEPSLDSGVAGGKQGSELTPTEQEQFCEAADAFGQELLSEAELKRALCTIQGVAFSLAQSGTVETCVTLRDGCLDAPDDDPTTGDPTGDPVEDMCDLGIDWTTCTATVAEIEACYEEYGRTNAALLKSFDCSKMEEYKATPPSQEPPPLGEACSLAQAKCPTVLGGAEDMP